MRFDEAFHVLQPLATDDYSGGAWPAIRVEKLHALFTLAQQIEHGVIVELGSFRGLGAIALALGASAPVYSIDRYEDWTDAAGYCYTPEDGERFAENIRRVGVQVTQVRGDLRALAATWDKPIGLLVWDLGVPTAAEDIALWLPHLAQDGIIAIKENGDQSFGSQALLALGLELYESYEVGCVFAYRRMLLQSVLWIVKGQPYIAEAHASMARVRQAMPALLPLLIYHEGSEGVHVEWYVEQMRVLNSVLAERPDGERILWLDADTYMAEPVPELIAMLDRFDLLLAHAPGHYTAPTVRQVPDAFPEFNIGVIAMVNNATIRELWQRVYHAQVRHLAVYGDNDQAPLREELYYDKSGLRWSVLPCEYNLRFGFGCLIHDKVKILHGRSDNYELLTRAINKGYQEGLQIPPRLWHPHGKPYVEEKQSVVINYARPV